MMKNTKLMIIADDLTGALDTGVQFAKKGIKAVVRISMNSGKQRHPDGNGGAEVLQAAQVLAVNTESRHDDPERAAEKVKELVQEALDAGIPYLYKKTDSALRGNVGAELESLYRTMHLRMLPFIPAFPGIGRTTVNGIQYINGIPVSESTVGKDPFDPVMYSEVSKILAMQSTIPSCSIPVPVENSLQMPEGISIFDGSSEMDLERTGSFLAEKKLLRVSAGCGGFAEVLAENLFERKEQERREGDHYQNMLLICGSITENALEQLCAARENGLSLFRIPDELLDAKQRKQPDISAGFAAEAMRPILCGKTSVLHTVDLEQTHDRKKTVDIDGNRIADGIGAVTKEIFDRTDPEVLCVFGGDTLLGIMNALEVDAICPERELFPGIVMGTFFYQNRKKRIITKAGSFGGREIIREIEEKLCEMS